MSPGFASDFLRERVFFAGLLLFVIFLPFSEALVSILSVFLLLQALILRSWNHPSVPRGRPVSLLMITSVFLIYILGMGFTRDPAFALYELKKVVFWIVIPVAFYYSPRLEPPRFNLLLLCFIAAVTAASLEATVRFLFREQLGITGFREIIHISHIRYSFQVILALILAGWFMAAGTPFPLRVRKALLLVPVMLWLLLFLLLLKSVTGVIALLGMVWVFLLVLAFRQRQPLQRGVLAAALVLLVLAPVGYVWKVWHDFHDSETLDPEQVDCFTLSGNPYSFDFSARDRENGHWVHAYLCVDELRREWNKVSSVDFDSPDGGGYPCSATLIRYMTSKGLRKDSAGVSQLTPTDIKAIERGIANHIYVNRSFSLYPRIYETIWEYDYYTRLGDPNHQSFSQRLEFVKASLLLIGKRPWLGIGTGNWKLAYAEAYHEMNSRLDPDNQGPSHNQYLNYLVKFGVVGFLAIMGVLLIPLFREGHRRNLVFWLFLVSMGFANFGDANLETHMGLSFFTFYYSLFLWHMPPSFRGALGEETVKTGGVSQVKEVTG